MSIADGVSDMLTRIRNAHKALKRVVSIPYSKQKEAIASVLKNEGYIRGYSVEKSDKGSLSVELKYYDGLPVIQKITRCSKPGCRLYSPIKKLPLVCNGLGIYILSTSKGVMSDAEARKLRVGGEVICSVF